MNLSKEGANRKRVTSYLHHRTSFLLLRSCELMNIRGGSRLEAAMQSESKRDDDRRTLSKGEKPPYSLPSEPSACSKRVVGPSNKSVATPQKLEEGEGPKD